MAEYLKDKESEDLLKAHERAIICAIMNEPNIFQAAKLRVTEDLLYYNPHKLIWRAVKDRDLLDPVLAIDAVEAAGDLDKLDGPGRGMAFIADIAKGGLIGERYYDYVSFLEREKKKRIIIEACHNIEAGVNTEGAFGDLDKFFKKLNDIEVHDSEFRNLLVLPTEEALDAKFKEHQSAYKTKYKFKKVGQEEYNLEIPVGAITFIAAPTSHGKSTFLRCLALDMAKEELEKSKGEQDGVVLYFSYEEDDKDVIAQMMNTYINIEFTKQPNGKSTHGCLQSLKEFLKDNSLKYIQREHRLEVGQKSNEFKEKFLMSGLMRVFYVNYTIEKLTKAIKYITKSVKVKAVFVDYIQMLQSGERNQRMSRPDELKSICSELKDLAVSLNLPIVCAAQLNRDGAKSPFDMRPQNMSESSDIEKIANVIVCMYNSDHKPEEADAFEKRKNAALKDFPELKSFIIGKHPTKIYATISKNRNGIVGGAAVLNFNGNTGMIEHNDGQKSELINAGISSFGKSNEERTNKEDGLPF